MPFKYKLGIFNFDSKIRIKRIWVINNLIRNQYFKK